MTQKANPSINRPAEAFKTAGAIAYGGGREEGFIVNPAFTTEISTQDPDISEGNLNGFNFTSSGLDVTVDAGEAFVFGSWICKDTSTTVKLADNTSSQTIFVGWDKGGTDDVIVGLNSAFATSATDSDQKIPVVTFDTSSGSVTASSDERRLGGDGSKTFSDGTPIKFGDGPDFEQFYDSIDDELKIFDAENDTEKIAFDKNGDVFVRNGALDVTGNIDTEGVLNEGQSL